MGSQLLLTGDLTQNLFQAVNEHNGYPWTIADLERYLDQAENPPGASSE